MWIRSAPRKPGRGSGQGSLYHLDAIPRILWHRRRGLGAALVLLLGAALVVHQQLPRHHHATVLLGKGGSGSSGSDALLGWRLENLSADGLAQLAKLEKTEALLEARVQEARNGGLLERSEWDASIRRGVNALTVEAWSLRGPDAAWLAERLAELLLERNGAFLRQQIESQVERMEQLRSREVRARRKLEDEIAALEKEHDLRFAEKKLQSGLEELASVARRRLLNRNEAQYLRSEIKILDQSLLRRERERANPTRRLSTPVAATTESPRLAELIERRQELLLALRPLLPRVQALDRRIAELGGTRIETASPGGEDEARGPSEEEKEERIRVAALRRHLASLEEEANALTRLESRWRTRLGTLDRHAPALTRLRDEIEVLQEREDAMAQRLHVLEQQREHPTGHYAIMDSASVSDIPEPRTPLGFLMGGAAGVWLTLVAFVGLRDLSRRWIQSPRDAFQTLGIPAYDATVLEGRSEQTTRAFFDRVLRGLLSQNPRLRSVAVVALDDSGDARTLWEHLGGALSRSGTSVSLFDLGNEESDPHLSLPATLSFWLGQDAHRSAALLLPDLRAGSHAANFAAGVDAVVVAAQRGTHRARELRFWLDTLPRGLRGTLAIVLTGCRMYDCLGVEKRIRSLEELRDEEMAKHALPAGLLPEFEERRRSR